MVHHLEVENYTPVLSTSLVDRHHNPVRVPCVHSTNVVSYAFTAGVQVSGVSVDNAEVKVDDVEPDDTQNVVVAADRPGSLNHSLTHVPADP